MYRLFLLISFFIFICFSGKAQAPMVTDRPGEGTDSPVLLTKGFAQLESGFFFQHDQLEGGGEATSFSIPTNLIRIGLLDNFEFRITRDILSEGSKAGIGPLNLGAKVGIAQENKGLPTIALLAALTLPNTGSEEYQTSFTQPSVKLLLNKTVNDVLAITANGGVEWENDQARAVYTYAVSFDLSLTDKAGGFVEFYGSLPEGRKNDHLINYGLTYLVSPNFQLDLSSGAAFTAEAPDYFVSAGLSWRVSFFSP